METVRPSILVIADQEPEWFSSAAAIAEILYLEGINDLETECIEKISADALEGRSLVVLGPCDLKDADADVLLQHVRAGGGLISILPGEALAKRLGLVSPLKGILNGRVKTRSVARTNVSLPIKGWAQFYKSAEGLRIETFADLLADNEEETGCPAIFLLEYGKGKVAVIAYDFAASLYLHRQGNPALAASRSTGFARMRPSDLFYEWQDARTAELPAADIQCHLFRELVHSAWPEETVLPWIWYFPSGAGTVLLFTSDDDWSTKDEFSQLVSALEENDASATFYMVEVDSTMDRVDLDKLVEKGFDFSIHPDLPPPTGVTWKRKLSTHITQFRDRYHRQPSGSVRNHCIAWSGYLGGARIESELGFDVDSNYLSVPENGRCYMAGAGLMMPFVDPSGEVLPIFQLPAQFTEETVLKHPAFSWSLNLSAEEGVRYLSRLLLENRDRNHSMMCINSHPVSFANYSENLWRPLLEFAKREGIPVLNVEQYSSFWKDRRKLHLRPVRREDLENYEAPIQGNFQVMLPHHT